MKKTILAIATLLTLLLLFVSCATESNPSDSQSSQGGTTESTSDPVSSDKTDETVDSSTDNSSAPSTDGSGDGSTTGSSTIPSTNDSSNTGTDGECNHRLGAPVTTKEPTCTEPGIKAQYCIYCDYYTERKVVPNGHKKVVDKGYDSTCSTNGLSDGSHCSVCGVIVEAQKELPFNNVHLEYGFKKIINEPNIGVSGSAIFACVKCGSEKVDKLEPMTTAPAFRPYPLM